MTTRKKKTKLQRRKSDPYSPYWKKKCWELLRKQFADKCKVCNATKFVNLHHLLDKKAFPDLCMEPMNLLPLCPKHHKFGRLSAHCNSVWFANWLEQNYPAQYKWVMEWGVLPKPASKLNYQATHHALQIVFKNS